MIDFNEKFKEYDNFQLYEIIANQNDYQEIAVEVAKNLFANRKITDEELDQLKVRFDAKQSLRLEKELKAARVENKIKEITDSAVLQFDPVKRGDRTADQTIIILSVIYTAIYLWSFFKSYKVLLIILSDVSGYPFVSTFATLFPFVITPFMIVLFFTHKKLGWRLFTISLMLNVIGLLSGVLVELTSPHSLLYNGLSISSVWGLVFNGGVLWVICRENMRAIYRVSKVDIIFSLVFSLVLMGLLLLCMFM